MYISILYYVDHFSNYLQPTNVAITESLTLEPFALINKRQCRPNEATLRFAINYAALKTETKFTTIASDND